MIPPAGQPSLHGLSESEGGHPLHRGHSGRIPGGTLAAHQNVLVDDRLCLVGSFNFDMRSAYLDTELMLAIDSEGLNAQLRQRAEDDLDHCRLVSAQGGDPGAPSLSPGS